MTFYTLSMQSIGTIDASFSSLIMIRIMYNVCVYTQWSAVVDFPSDAEKIQKVKLLVDNGYAHRILMSHDIHTKHRLVRLLMLTILTFKLNNHNTTGVLWWSWLRPHSRTNCTKDGRQGNPQGHH